MTPATSTAATDAPPRHRIGLAWKIIYALVLAGIATAAYFVEEWYYKLSVVLVFIVTVLRIIRTETEHLTTSRGACRYCGAGLTEADRECPSCDRPVPKEQRLGLKQ